MDLLMNESNITGLQVAYYASHDHWYNQEDEQYMEKFLTENGFHTLVDLFKREKLDINALQMLSDSRIDILLSCYPMGVRIKFQNILKNWLQNFATESCVDATATNLSLKGPALSEMLSTEEGLRLKNSIGNEVMTKIQRRSLIKLICCNYLDRGIVIGQSEVKKLTAQIIELFPREKASSFFDAETKKGPFITRANYLIRQYRDNQRIQKSAKRPRNDENCDYDRDAPVVFTHQTIKANQFVKDNHNLNFNELMPHWRESAAYRIKFLQDLNVNPDLSIIFSNYAAYQRSDGSLLINSDFASLHPYIEFKDTLEDDLDKLLEILKHSSKTAKIKNVIKKISASSPENIKICAAIIGLHSALYAPAPKEKFTILDTIDDTIKFFVNSQEFEAKLNAISSSLKLPWIAAVGSIFDGSMKDEFYVVLHDVIYKFSSLLDTLELFIHAYALFINVNKFSKRNEKFVHFLLQKFCSIDTKYSAPSLTELLNMMIRE